MFGSFMQWIVFDFGKRPVLVRKLNVELGTQKNQEQIKRLRKELNFDRYCNTLQIRYIRMVKEIS